MQRCEMAQGPQQRAAPTGRRWSVGPESRPVRTGVHARHMPVLFPRLQRWVLPLALLSAPTDVTVARAALEPIASSAMPGAVVFSGMDVPAEVNACLAERGFVPHGALPAMGVDVAGMSHSRRPRPVIRSASGSASGTSGRAAVRPDAVRSRRAPRRRAARCTPTRSSSRAISASAPPTECARPLPSGPRWSTPRRSRRAPSRGARRTKGPAARPAPAP